VHAGRTVTAMTSRETETRKRWDWSLNNWGNRLLYSVLAGLVVNISTGIYALGTVIAVVLFVLTTAIVEVVRRR